MLIAFILERLTIAACLGRLNGRFMGFRVVVKNDFMAETAILRVETVPLNAVR